MLFLILSIVCSVTVGVLFKWFRNHAAFNSKAIIATNYAIALLLCYFCFPPEFSRLAEQAPWPLYLALGLLLPGVFFIAFSIHSAYRYCQNRCRTALVVVYSVTSVLVAFWGTIQRTQSVGFWSGISSLAAYFV